MSLARPVLALTLAALLPATTGCINTMRVQEWDEAKQAYVSLPGVPFFGKRQVSRQETTWQETWRTVHVLAAGPGGDVEVVESLRVDAEAVGPLAALRAAVARYDAAPDKDAAYSDVLRRARMLPPPGAPRLTSNTVSRAVVPDGFKRQFLNAPLPWFGSATVSADVATDGTLTKASTTAETGITSFISDALPALGDLGFLGDTEAFAPDGEGGPEGMVTLPTAPAGLRLIEAVEGRVTTFRYDHDGIDNDTPLAALTGSEPFPVSVTHRPLNAPKAASDPTKTVKVSGSLVLP